MHNLASNSKDPKWADSMRHLAKVGDAFTSEHLKTVDMQKLDPIQAQILKKTLSATADRVTKEDAKEFTRLIEIRLERAAWVDLGCNSLEGTLVPWTLKFLRQHLDAPGVDAELKRIQSDYVPKDEQKTLYGPMQERVRRYVGQLLSK